TVATVERYSIAAATRLNVRRAGSRCRPRVESRFLDLQTFFSDFERVDRELLLLQMCLHLKAVSKEGLQHLRNHVLRHTGGNGRGNVVDGRQRIGSGDLLRPD